MPEIVTIDYGAYLENAERFCSCLLSDPQILDSMKLKSEMLLLPKCRLFVEALQSQYRAGIKPDLLTIRDALSGPGVEIESARTWSTQSLHAFSSANWEFYENKLIDAWIKSRTIQLAYRVLGNVNTPSMTAQDMVEMVEETQTEIATLETHDKIQSADQIIIPVISLIEARYKLHGRLPGISTGLSELDAKTLGMQEQRLWVIGARPSQGKSALMGQIARHVAMAEKVPVGVITIESSATEFGMRSLAAIGQMDATKLNRGQLTEKEFGGINHSSELFAGMGKNFVVYDKPRMTVSEVWSICRRMVIKNNVKVIFIDYLQRIKVPKQKTRFDEVAVATTELKEIARDLNITVVAMAQLRREADDKKPGLGDFQYTSQIEQDADVAILIWHEEGNTEAFDKQTNQKYKVPYKKSWLIAEKVRDGQTGQIEVYFKREHMTFGEVEKNH